MQSTVLIALGSLVRKEGERQEAVRALVEHGCVEDGVEALTALKDQPAARLLSERASADAEARERARRRGGAG